MVEILHVHKKLHHIISGFPILSSKRLGSGKNGSVQLLCSALYPSWSKVAQYFIYLSNLIPSPTQQENVFDTILYEEFQRPHRGKGNIVHIPYIFECTDFILNLAYNLHFGETYENWERDQHGISPETKVLQLKMMLAVRMSNGCGCAASWKIVALEH